MGISIVLLMRIFMAGMSSRACCKELNVGMLGDLNRSMLELDWSWMGVRRRMVERLLYIATLMINVCDRPHRSLNKPRVHWYRSIVE